ncbi:MAG: TlpA family protein disulfide reductase [Lachnospiraceae bacterium]|nr:TlpA family protein disulfide reductase [Lachnospiraceae bacterium]
MRKKTTLIIAAASLVFALLTGCGDEKKTTGSEITSGTTSVSISSEESASEEDNSGKDTEAEDEIADEAEEDEEDEDIEEDEEEDEAEEETDGSGRKKKKKKKKTTEDTITTEETLNDNSNETSGESTASTAGNATTEAHDLSNRPNADTGTGTVKKLSKGDVAPDFTAELSGGGTFKLSDYDDKVVLINFWATWCGYCIEEMPAFERLKNDGIEDFELVCINCGEDEGTVDSFVNSEGYSFNFAYDPYYRIGDYYPSNGLPYTVIVERGVVYKVISGARSYSDYKAVIEDALGK